MPLVDLTLRVKRRALLSPATILAACALTSLLAGCGGGSSSSSTPVATLPVTSGNRLLFDTFAVGDTAFPSGIDTIAPDGSNVQQVVAPLGGGMPRFSADGNKIICTTGSGVAHIAVFNADGSNSGNTNLASGDPNFPAFRPDGKAIVYTFNPDLYTQNIDGSSARKIYTSQAGYGASRPVYMPDGNHIVFEQDPNVSTSDTPKVYIINADGGNRRQIGSGFSITPAVSPDGRRIAYSGRVISSNTTMGLFLVNSDGTGQTSGPLASDATHPVFSPDGTKLAYLKLVNQDASSGGLTYEIHTINVDGTGDTRVGTKVAEGTFSLDWR